MKRNIFSKRNMMNVTAGLLLKIGLLFCITIAISACGGHGRINYSAIDIAKDYQLDKSEKTDSRPVIEQTISIDLVTTNTLLLKNSTDQSLSEQPTTYYTEVTSDFNRDDAKQVDNLVETYGTDKILVLDNYGNTISKIFKDNLETRFRSAVVNIKELPIDKAQYVIKPVLDVNFIWAGKDAYVALKVMSDTGKSFIVYGKGHHEISKLNMIWAIPLNVVTFPVGLVITSRLIVPLLQLDATAISILEAYHDASKLLADQIAEQVAINPSDHWIVSLE